MQTTHASLVKILFDEIWNQKRLDKITEVFASDCQFHTGTITQKGSDFVHNTFSLWQIGFPDLTHQVDKIIDTEDKVIVQWHGWGTHLGIFLGMLPTNKKIQYYGITIFKVENGKFSEIWLASDLQGIFTPLKAFSDKVYTENDFCEDFQGPAAEIYAMWMKGRTTRSAKQTLANGIRELFSAIPADGQPALTIPSEIIEEVDVQEHWFPEQHRNVRALVYLPKGYEKNHYPILVYYHGGGWTTGSPESTDLITRKLSHRAKMIVISVDYRLAPEFPYPCGLDDCVAGYKWAREHGEKLFHANNKHIAVGGDSCGGNLSAAVIIATRNTGYPIPDANLMLCPLTDFSVEKYPSTFKNGYRGLCYDYAFLCLVRANYAKYTELTIPTVSPMYDDLHDFCPSFVLTAGYDPLYDENFAFVKKMQDVGNVVEHVVHEDMPHAYYYFLGLTKREEEAYQKMCDFLNKYSGLSVK